MKSLLLKSTLAVIVVLFGVKSVCSQEVQLATLQHGNNMQVFYGAEALKNALEVAMQGDLVTLSAGTFNAVIIDKGVTIQGAGYVTDPKKAKLPSVINGLIEIKGGTENVTIEGIYNNGEVRLGSWDNYGGFSGEPIVGLTLKKCRFYTIFDYAYSGRYGKIKNCIIEQCRIASSLNFGGVEQENIVVRNSIISQFVSGSNNSNILVENSDLSIGTSKGVLFKNNIIFNGSLDQSSSAYNNVFLTPTNLDQVSVKSGNIESEMNAMFVEAIYSYTDMEAYALTESARTTYLGTDGTQVGIYGGVSPFSDVPTNPQIISKNIDAQSSSDGKLKVNITVKAQNK